MTTNPQSEVKCCEFNKRCCDGKKHLPKESPVSQTVEGWEEVGIGEPALNHLADIIIDDTSDRANRIRKIKNAINKIILKARGETLSTLIKEMEKEMKSTENCACEGVDGGSCIGECDVSFNAGISAAQKIVKKMV